MNLILGTERTAMVAQTPAHVVAGALAHLATHMETDCRQEAAKPCVFVKSPGIGSFARSLAARSGAAPGTHVIRLRN